MSETSASPDLTESLPFDLGSNLLSSYPASARWDVSFGNLGFILAPTEQNPYQRSTEQVRKQQIDTSEAPGEQSLSSWWTRSQESWDLGAGIKWYEPGSDEATVDRYADSLGIDPWTAGEVKLLKKMADPSADRGATAHVAGLETATGTGYVEAYGSTVAWTALTGTGSHSTTLPSNGATQPAAAGGIAYVGHNGGVSVYTPGSAVTTPITCTGIARAWWVKARLIVALGNKLFECAPGATVSLGAATPICTHPSSTWVWSDVTETSGAILASGYSQGDSAIFRFVIENDETTNTPILTGASQVGRTPPGERITCMSVYLGTIIVLGTSQGVRVGRATDDGAVQYGPLTVTTNSDVTDVTFRDRFAYLAVTNALPGAVSGSVRVDLSAPIPETTPDGSSLTGLYAWAWDAYPTNTGTASSIALVGERVVLCVGQRTSVQSATAYYDEGWLTTGGIRYATVEQKAFRYVRMVCSTNAGGISLSAIAADESEHFVARFTDSFSPASNLALTIPARPLNQHLALKLTLSANDPGTGTPVLSALALYAQPAPTRVRLYSFPIHLYDLEEDRRGSRCGRAGGAYERLMALEAAEELGAPIQVTDHRTKERFVGIIDSVDFTAKNPAQGEYSNFEGIGTVVVRRL